MICSHCGGTVVWMGPMIALTHTQCRDCGGINCQEIEETASEEFADLEMLGDDAGYFEAGEIGNK